MATRRYMINKGEQQNKVTEAVGAAIVTKKIEVTVDLASSLTKTDVVNGLKEISNYIAKSKWPPA